MPWSNQTGGGPWGGGGGNNGSGGGGGPWGPGSGGRGPQGSPPDLEDIIRRGQDRLRQALPSGGRASPALFGLIAIILIAVWAFQAIYTVQPDELAVELRFGKPKDEISEPGLHFHWWPVETVEKVQIVEKQIAIGNAGSISRGARRPAIGRADRHEGLGQVDQFDERMTEIAGLIRRRAAAQNWNLVIALDRAFEDVVDAFEELIAEKEAPLVYGVEAEAGCQTERTQRRPAIRIAGRSVAVEEGLEAL